MQHAAESENVALVTGASSGIGRHIAEALCSAGYHTFGTSRSSSAESGAMDMLQLDVTSQSSVEACVAAVIEKAGRIDLLVNNAGMMQVGLAEETDLATAQRIFEVNFWGAVRVTDAVLAHMRPARRGRIINVGSLGAWVGEPGEAFYSASKRALAGYTESLRHEVWPLGLHVSILEPGAFRTGFLTSAPRSDVRLPAYDGVRAAVENTMTEGMQAGQDPRRVAELVLEIARTHKPRLRYGVGRGARVLPLMKVLMPQNWFDRLLRRGYGLRRR